MSGQVFQTNRWHQAHLSLQGALQPAGVVELAVLHPACWQNPRDQGTGFKGELVILTRTDLNGSNPPGLKLLPLFLWSPLPFSTYLSPQ